MFGGKTGGFTSFGSTTPSNFGTFGQSSTGFGSGGSAFGAQAPGSGTSLFGGAASASTPGTGTSLFGQSGTTGFGQPQSTNAFSFGNNSSSGLFGNVSQTGTGSLFSSPGTGAGFGAKTGFSGFGTVASNPSTGGLFGSATNTTSSLFGQPSATAAFGNVASVSGGTTIGFNPPAGQDTMMKSGVTTNINTRHQCITAMKEYENKSLEELRVEDYAANRKSKQVGSTTTGGLFGPTQGTQPTTGSGFVFGGGLSSTLQPSNTTGFGGFGTTPSTGSTFNQNRPLFGTATTTQSGFTGFGSTTGTQQSTSLFGSNAAKPLFGTTGTSQPTGSSFFQTSTSNPIGFGTNTQTGSLFGLPKPAGFGTATTSSIGFGTPATSSIGFGSGGNLFAKPASTASTFGGFGTNTSTGAFGTNTSTTGFGSTSGGGLFNMKPIGFGTTSTGLGSGGTTSFGFGGGLGTGTSTNAFGTSSAKPGFGFNFGGATTGSTGFGSLTSTGSNTGTFGLGGGTNTLGAMVTAPSQVTNNQHLLALASSPYGDNPLFWNLKQQTKERRDEALKPTNPNAQKAALTSVNQYTVSHRPSPKLKPKSLHHLINGGKAQLFEGLEDEDFSNGENTFVPRKSVKKLVLRKGAGSKSTSDSTLVYSEAGGDFSQVTDSSNNKTQLPLPITRRLSLTHKENLAEHMDPSMDTPVARNLSDPLSLDENNVATGQRSNNNYRLNASDTTTSFLESSGPDNSCLPVDRSTPHPTGVTLTRPGYYTIPTLDEMISCMDESGNCFVEDLVIGRTGYGHVLFRGLTNVAGLNLDELVHFRRKEIVIYPDDDNKPPLGQGLNKKAEVTLESVWPLDKTTKTPIKNPERLNLMNYTTKIEAITENIGAKFIDYRMETGSWVFEVSHFSRYSLMDNCDYYLNEVKVPGHEKCDFQGQAEPVNNQQQFQRAVQFSVYL